MGKRPIVLTSLSSSGTAKSTNFANIAFCVGSKGYTVRIIELDNRNSLKTCCGLDSVEPRFSTSAIFEADFKGDYPFVPIWEKHLKGAAQLLLSHRQSQVVTESIVGANPRGIFSLRKILRKYPIDCDLLILDCPGQQSTLTDAAILASTHILIGIEPTKKCFEDASFFLEHLYSLGEDVEPLPELLGFLTGKFNIDGSFQREGVNQLYDQAQLLDVELFNPIRYSPHFETSYALGIPIQVFLPSFGGVRDYLDEGNFFKRDHRKIEKFDPKFKKLPAIVPHLISLIRN